MPPKQRITKEMIMESAFSVFRREGMDSVNARSVARELHCSTQPIFSYYTGMGELKGVLEEKARDAFHQSMAETLTSDNAMVEACKAYVRFAHDEPMLFRHLFIETSRGLEDLASYDEVSAKIVRHAMARYGLDEDRAAELMHIACAYTHGLASVQATGVFAMDLTIADERLETLVSRMLKAYA